MEKTYCKYTILLINDWDGFQAAMRKGLFVKSNAMEVLER